MDESSRFRFFSLTFLVGFGVGAFVGVALGLMAFAVVGETEDDPDAEAVASSPTPGLSGSANLTPTPVRARTTSAIDVRIGPGSDYAAVGTIARGEILDLQGRDESGEWIAVRFPPGSSARGWLPARAIENLTNVSALAVVIPTPLARSIPTPSRAFVTGSPSAPGSIEPNEQTTTRGPSSTPVTPRSGTAAPTSTPRPSGPPDLAVTAASRLSDGRVRVTIINRGSGDLVGHQVMAIVADPTTRSETLRAPGTGLRAGESITLESDSFLVTEPTPVIATVDPSFSYPDGDRSNNTLTVSLGPPPTPAPTPDPSTN